MTEKIQERKNVLIKNFQSDIFNIKQSYKSTIRAVANKTNSKIEFNIDSNRNKDSYNNYQKLKFKSKLKENSFSPKYKDNDPAKRLKNEFNNSNVLNEIKKTRNINPDIKSSNTFEVKTIKGLFKAEQTSLNKNKINLQGTNATPFQRKIEENHAQNEYVSSILNEYKNKNKKISESMNLSYQNDSIFTEPSTIKSNKYYSIKANNKEKDNFQRETFFDNFGKPEIKNKIDKTKWTSSGLDWKKTNTEIIFKDNTKLNSSNGADEKNHKLANKYIGINGEGKQIYSMNICEDLAENGNKNEIKKIIDENYCKKSLKTYELSSTKQGTEIFKLNKGNFLN